MPYVNCCLRNIGCKWWSKILKFWSRFLYGIKIATFGLGWQIGGGKYLPPAKLLMFSASSWVQVRGVLLRSIFIFPTRLCEHPLISIWFSTIVQALTQRRDNLASYIHYVIILKILYWRFHYSYNFKHCRFLTNSWQEQKAILLYLYSWNFL